MQKLLRPAAVAEDVTIDAFLQSMNYSDWLMNEKLWLFTALMYIVASSREDYPDRVSRAARIVVYYQRLADELGKKNHG